MRLPPLPAPVFETAVLLTDHGGVGRWGAQPVALGPKTERALRSGGL